jgi:tetratricopeptide (TPR) repeat protein
LENLSDEAGAEVLKNLGVKGTKKELLDTSREFKGHALALNLLGSYLATVHGGEIRKKNLVPGLEEDERQGGHARRVMESYEIWLKGKPELDILYVMGLFDRPADEGAVQVLREKPAIKGVTENIVKLSEADWKFAVKRLRELRLLAVEEKGEKGRLDCHPLIREHFGAKLKVGNPAAWREAHRRLYEYFRDLPEKELPDTLEEMEPLFCAVAHGCQAGRHQETYDEVYNNRIRRGEDYYVYHKLGAFGADLAALSGFFVKPWSKPEEGLTDDDKAIFLSCAGFCLRAVGRLSEAAEPMKVGIERSIQDEDWIGAAIDTENLSELYLTLGEVERAVEYGREGVEFADRSGDLMEKIDNRTTLADALHQAGEIGEAEELFDEAEVMEKERTGYEYLYSVNGFRFCDLLLSQGRYGEVKRRAGKTLEWGVPGDPLLDIALEKLSLGRAYLLEAVKKGTDEYGKAKGYLEGAVEGLREAGQQDELPRGLIARAALYRHVGEYEKAWRDLEEAREIAERGEMKLHLADCGLEAARIWLAQKKKKEARAELEKAKGLVEETGYGRRKGEVEELEKQLGRR